MMNKTHLFIIFLYINTLIYSQERIYVTDIQSGKPIPSATIRTNDTNVITNELGISYIYLKSPDTLIIQHLSYEPKVLVIANPQHKTQVKLNPINHELQHVTIQAPFLSNSYFTSPTSISSLSKIQLETTNTFDFTESINQVAGTYVHSGSYNTKRITIRGIGSRSLYSSNRIKAYFNFIPLSLSDGTTTIEDIDGTSIYSIEILKGAKSAFYGAGLGGVILLNTPVSFQEGIHGKFHTEMGSFGAKKVALTGTIGQDKLQSSFSISQSKNDGYRENSSYQRLNALYTLHYNTSKNSVQFIAQWIDLKAYIPSSLNKTDFKQDPSQAAGNWLSVNGYETYQKLISGISNTYRFNDNWQNTSTVFFNYKDAFEVRPFNTLDDSFYNLGFNTGMKYKYKAFTFQGSGEFIFEQYSWKLLETQQDKDGDVLSEYAEKRYLTNLFLGASYTGTHFIGEAGLNYNSLIYTIDQHYPNTNNHPEKYTFHPEISPFIGLSYLQNQQWVFYTNVGKGFSYPSVEETLLPEGSVNNSIKAERGINFDMGSRYNSANQNVSADVCYYYMAVKDLLVTKRITEEIFMGINAGKSTHQGIELNTRYKSSGKITNGLPLLDIRLSGALSENKFAAFTDNNQDYSGNLLPGVPKFTLHSSITYRLISGIYFILQGQAYGIQYMNDSNTETYHPYQLLHAKLGFISVSSFVGKLHVYAGIKNLLNEQYASMILINAPQFGTNPPRYYYPGLPRNYYIGLAVDF